MQRKYADPPPQFADIGRWCGFFMSLRGVALTWLQENRGLSGSGFLWNSQIYQIYMPQKLCPLPNPAWFFPESRQKTTISCCFSCFKGPVPPSTPFLQKRLDVAWESVYHAFVTICNPFLPLCYNLAIVLRPVGPSFSDIKEQGGPSLWMRSCGHQIMCRSGRLPAPPAGPAGSRRIPTGATGSTALPTPPPPAPAA